MTLKEETLELILGSAYEGIPYTLALLDKEGKRVVGEHARDFGGLIHALVYFTDIGLQNRVTYKLTWKKERQEEIMKKLGTRSLGQSDLSVLQSLLNTYNSMMRSRYEKPE